MSEWINAKERLPSPYKGVIVAYEADRTDGYIEYDYCYAFYNGKFWVATGFNVQNARIGCRVVAWMPIPPLPKEPPQLPKELELFNQDILGKGGGK